MIPGFCLVTMCDADANPVSHKTYARPVMVLVWCEDGTCELYARPDGSIEGYAGTLRGMADSLVTHPEGYVEERREP